MRYLVLTDIHANLEALDACLADAAARGYDRVLLLGDIVGYGPDPNEVVARVRELDVEAVVRGNHDKVASGLESSEGFNAVARRAAKWTFDQLTPEHRAWVANLPVGPVQVNDLIEICHGSPFDEDAYVFDELDAVRSLKAATRPVCLFGHTHYPVTFAQSGPKLEVIGHVRENGSRLEFTAGSRYLINPGSVGQPRDGDARAAYAIVDAGPAPAIDLVRLDYPVDVTQTKIATAGLPAILGERLTVGR